MLLNQRDEGENEAIDSLASAAITQGWALKFMNSYRESVASLEQYGSYTIHCIGSG